MAENVASVVKGYLGGRQAAQQEKFTGLKMEAVEQDMLAKQRQAEKAERIGILSEEAMTPDAEARQRAFQGLAAEGKEGVERMSQISNVQQQEREHSLGLIRNNLNAVSALPPEERGQELQKVAKFAARAPYVGFSEDQANKISKIAVEDPETALTMAKAMAGEDMPSDRVSANMVEFQNPATGEKKRVDVNSREGAEWATTEGGDWKMMPKSSVQLTGEFTPSQRGGIEEKLREAEISTRNALATAGDAIRLVEDDPDAFTKTGDFGRVAAGLATEVEALSRAFGMEIPADIQDAESYANTFKELGVNNTQAQNAILDLSIAYAGAIGLGQGRALTESDLRRAMRRVGGNGINTPEARKASLESVRDIIERNFRTRYRVMTGEPFEGDLGGAPAEADREIGESAGGDIPTISGDDEYRQLPSGATFIGPDGVKRTKP